MELSREKKSALSFKQQLESLTAQREEMAKKCGAEQDNSAEAKIDRLETTISQLKQALEVLAIES